MQALLFGAFALGGSTPATPTPTGAPRSSVTVTTVSPIDARPE